MSTAYSAVLQGQTRSNQGGLVHRADTEQILERFLILGTLQGSFYVNAFDLTEQTTNTIRQLYQRNYQQVLDKTVEISDAGRAPSNTPALFVLAVGAAYEGPNQETIRAAALDVLPRVARTGTHLFEFVGMIDTARGWGSGLRRGISNWYTRQDTKSLAFGVTKYAQRNGWSHADILRLAHPKVSGEMDALFYYIVKGSLGKFQATTEAYEYLQAVQEAKASTDPVRIAELVRQYRLPREVLPTEMLNDPNVWEALLYAPMPVMAMVRNAGNLHRAGLINRSAAAQQFYVNRLLNREVLRKSRIHPFDILKASLAYDISSFESQFRGLSGYVRGNKIDNPSRIITRALDEAAERAFENIEPTGKSIIQGIDVSSSMSHAAIDKLPLTAALAAAYMAYQTVKVERFVETQLFSQTIQRANIPTSGGLLAVAKELHGKVFGGTNIPLIIDNARIRKDHVDLFAIYTDSENGNRERAATTALREYRYAINPDARLVVIQTAVNEWSTNGNLPNTLEVVGFDTSVPRVVSEFARGTV